MKRRPLAVLTIAGVAASLLVTGGAAASPTKLPAASAKSPAIGIPMATLRAAFHCKGAVKGASKEPVMLVTGTGASGDEAYLIGKGAFEHFGHGVCYMNYPHFTTADIQTSVQYLVYGIRREARMYGGKIAIFGISQGGLLPRVALTYWPGLRHKVSDVVAAAGTQHGTTVREDGKKCSASNPCLPAGWQQEAGSHFLTALNAEPIEAPGPTAWTTVRSSTDEVVQPQTGKHPASALTGATNILIQKICPGRKVSHIGTALDSVTFAAFVDAIRHPGPAKVSRLPKNVCSHPYAPGLSSSSTAATLSGSNSLIDSQEAGQPMVKKEPAVRGYVTLIEPNR
jgi:triacylglycerol lipase